MLLTSLYNIFNFQKIFDQILPDTYLDKDLSYQVMISTILVIYSGVLPNGVLPIKPANDLIVICNLGGNGGIVHKALASHHCGPGSIPGSGHM